MTLQDIASWAAAHDYEALEVAAWPALGDRPFPATHLDVEGYDRDAFWAEAATKQLVQLGVWPAQ